MILITNQCLSLNIASLRSFWTFIIIIHNWIKWYKLNRIKNAIYKQLNAKVMVVAYEISKLLFIIYTFVKHVLAITFLYYFLFLAETYMICVNVFMYSETKFQLDPTIIEYFPVDSRCKNRSLWQRYVYRHDVAKVSEFYNGGLRRKSMSFVRSTEISFLST